MTELVQTLRNMAAASWAIRYEHDTALLEAALALVEAAQIERSQSGQIQFLDAKCAELDAENARLNRSISDVTRERDALRGALSELHAMVWGECPSLLDEDSGGTARLDIAIRELLK